MRRFVMGSSTEGDDPRSHSEFLQVDRVLTDLSGFTKSCAVPRPKRMSALPCMLIANYRTTGGVMGHPALDVIEELASRGLFRERDLTHRKISIDWLNTARIIGPPWPPAR